MDSYFLSSVEHGKYKILELKGSETVNLMKISPCFHMVAFAEKQYLRLFKLDLNGLICGEIMSYHSNFEIEDVKWSPNSEALLVISLQDCHFVAICPTDKEFLFRVQEPTLVKLVSVEWMPNSLHLISISDFNIFSFIHSLHDGRRRVLPSICCTNYSQPLKAFSCNGKYLALIHYVTSAYHVTVMSCTSLHVLWTKRADLISIQGLQWSPDSSLLALWDFQRKVKFIDACGEIVQTLHFQDSLAIPGFSATSFSPNSDLFLATLDDDQILVYNLNTWQLCARLNKAGNDFKKFTDKSDLMLNQNDSSKRILSFSPCGDFLSSSITNGVVIWDMREGCKLCAFFEVQNDFGEFQWHPKKNKLAVSIDERTVLIWKWTQDGPSRKKRKISTITANIPSASTMTWSQNKLSISSQKFSHSIIIIRNKEKFTL